MGWSRNTMDLLWRIGYVEVDRKLVGMDIEHVLMNWRNGCINLLWKTDLWVRGSLNQEPDNQDRTVSNPTYLKFNVKLNTINIHISHYLLG